MTIGNTDTKAVCQYADISTFHFPFSNSRVNGTPLNDTLNLAHHN